MINLDIKYVCYLIHRKNEANRYRHGLYVKMSTLNYKKMSSFDKNDKQYAKLQKMIKKIKKETLTAANKVKYFTPKLRKLRLVMDLIYHYDGCRNMISGVYQRDSVTKQLTVIAKDLSQIKKFHDEYVAEQILLGEEEDSYEI